MTITAMPPRFLGDRVQLAYVVRDLDAALSYWTDVMKVGPFVVIESAKGNRKIMHRGEETALDFTLAFAYMGETQIEVITPKNDAPSSYKEFLDSGREGLHHVAYWPEDMPGACSHLERHGFKPVTAVLAPDGDRSVVYYDAPSAVGAMVELLPMNAERMAYYSRIQKLSATWDGVTRPVRRFADRAEFLASDEGL
ncbi:VOC family protein [Celeribacter naphthalenivorans]|uniref:VOC family protein n=1 Tax=Celeribacter naphthalenivorans TaxID=1614694 RepID=UPI001CF9D79C|nr:VOC family protein [Celeribacter naphthalenivorans]